MRIKFQRMDSTVLFQICIAIKLWKQILIQFSRGVDGYVTVLVSARYANGVVHRNER